MNALSGWYLSSWAFIFLVLQTFAGFDYSFMRFSLFCRGIAPRADESRQLQGWQHLVDRSTPKVDRFLDGKWLYDIWPSFVLLVLAFLELLGKRIWPQFRPLLQLGRSLAIMVAMTAMINRFRIGTIRLVSHWESWGYEWNYVYLCMICLSNESLHKGFSLQWSL